MVGCSNRIAVGYTGWIIILCILSIFTGCSGTEVGNPDTGGISPARDVQPIASDAELEAYLKEQYAKSINVNASGENTSPELDGGEANGSNDDASTPAGTYTQTNIQEAGVDESDVVKTDGHYFYVASGRSFHVVDITGAMQVVATHSVDGHVDALYLYDDKLVVLYATSQNGSEPWDDIAMPMAGQLFGMPWWLPSGQRLAVAIYDISDPQNPTPLKTYEFDGYMVSSRLIGGRLHLVQQFIPALPPLDYWYDGTPEDMKKTIESNQLAIDGMTLSQLIPFYRVVSDPFDSQLEMPAVSSNNFYCPVTKDGGGTITTIVSFDLDDAALPFESIGIVADAHIVYASAQSLYIASHKYIYDAQISEETTLYKFDLTGEVVRYMGGGVIPGWILNQFSLGEYQDVLRVATTTGHVGGWQPFAKNNVYCLKSEEKALKIIGRIENLAPGEQIYAARFMGERGYLVTYVKIDPLFTLDLSDPYAPQVAGELKVPGYSDYIHPYGNDYLITLGKDAILEEEDNMAWYQGVQLSIFDIRDFSQPTLLQKTIIGDRGTRSEALHNHKAFTFWVDNDLLALPIDLYEHASPPDHPSTSGSKIFEGLYVYRVTPENGFNFLGRISTDRDPVAVAPYGAWTRGIFVDQQVYAVTDDAVRSARIDQIEESIQTIRLNNGD